MRQLYMLDVIINEPLKITPKGTTAIPEKMTLMRWFLHLPKSLINKKSKDEKLKTLQQRHLFK